jgi:starch-binding outer membrane protein, SusD/RagB family
VPTGGDLTPAIKNSRLGEAHFLRALAYFELVQAFGDVTLNLTGDAAVSTTATRAPAADVYKAIIADLDAAIELLPETQAEWGRARKGAAQHLLAKVYLTRGYKTYGEGNADFQKALDLAQAVITSGRYPLSPVYADLFCGTHTADQNAPDPNRQGFCNTLNYNEQNPEIIFSVQYSYNPQQYAPCGQANTSDCASYLHLVYLARYDNDNNIAVGLPRDLNNGRPFRRIRGTPFLFSLYDRTRWTGTPGASDILDTRFDGTFQTLWYANTAGGRNGTGACPQNCTNGQVLAIGDTALWMPGYQVTDAFRQTKKFQIYVPCAQQDADPAVDCGRDNKLRRIYGWEVGPSMKKHQDNARTGGVADQAGGKDVILMRSGETYLIAAEAAFKLGQLQQAADFINVLRQRAASPAHKADWRTFMEVKAGDITLDFIMDERARELAGEMNRWQDLVRPGAQYFVDRLKRRNVDARPNVQLHHALRPIPQQQINGVTGAPYPQNPGY